MQTVDFSALVQNAMYFKKLLGHTKLCAVVKNNAYGHGLVRTASALCDVADYFAVGSVWEAMQISPYSKNTLVLLPVCAQQVQPAVEMGAVLTVDSFETLEIVARAAKTHVPRVHIKVDTGMNRLGFSVAELPAIAASPNIKRVAVEGVFSHFFADTPDACDNQLQLFNTARKILAPIVEPDAIFHIANTSASLLDKKYRLDMARIGLGLYGYGEANLTPVKTVTAPVIAVKNVCAGQVVGYGGTYTFPADTKIAVLHTGYANGYVRALKNSTVMMCNTPCRVVGNVCMATCMVDVGTLPVKVGDQAILLGSGINCANADVSVYELLCNLS